MKVSFIGLDLNNTIIMIKKLKEGLFIEKCIHSIDNTCRKYITKDDYKFTDNFIDDPILSFVFNENENVDIYLSDLYVGYFIKNKIINDIFNSIKKDYDSKCETDDETDED